MRARVRDVEHSTLTEQLGYMSYFVASFPKGAIAQYGTWQGKTVNGNAISANGTDVGGFVVLNTGSSSSVEFFVGLSSISIDQARKNIQGKANEHIILILIRLRAAQINGRNFDAIRTETQVSLTCF